MRSQRPTRIRLLSILICLGALVLIGKLYMLQVVHGSAYSERADRQYQKPNQNLYDRGTIFFTTKNGVHIGAGTLTTGFTVAINPKILSDAETAYGKIASIYPLDKDSFLTKAAKKSDPYEEILKRVPDDSGVKIDALDIHGVSIYKDRWRFYPGGRMASHTLGFVGFKGDVLAGRYGLENSYETTLRRDDVNLNVNFFAQLFSDIGATVLEADSRAGDIVSTIEPFVQTQLESELQKVNTSWNSNVTGGIIMDPKTGEIVAMATTPDFDPNTFNKEKNTAIFGNPLVENVYEMGSIIKPLTMAGGIDSGAVTATTTYNDEGFVELNGYKIYNFDHKGRGVTDMQQVLSESLNTGASFVALRIGNEKFSHYLESFGIGEKTGIDLPNEVKGIISNLKSPRDVEHATASFGQGIAMTPIETVRALATLANGGVLTTPHLIKSINYKLGYSKTISYPEGNRVFKKEASDAVTKMLVEVVDKALKNGKVKLDNWRVAAKTGTAQIAKETGGGYYEDRYLHSFFGYFPAYNPKFIVFLYTVYPKGANFASETLTVPFMDLTKFLINYYEIPPDR